MKGDVQMLRHSAALWHWRFSQRPNQLPPVVRALDASEAHTHSLTLVWSMNGVGLGLWANRAVVD
jgi:hypothetical protein